MVETVTVVLIKILKLVDLCILFSFLQVFKDICEVCEYGPEIQLTVKYLCNLIILYIIWS